jgi:LacI family transcriptional regulator
MTRRVTSHDIALRAGVSRTTVSQVLNRRMDANISTKTRERVFQIAGELGYVPNSAARMLVSGRTRMLGLILSHPYLLSVDAFVPQMMYGISQVCQARGYELLVEAVEHGADAESYLRLTRGKRIDALIVLDPRDEDVGLRELIASKFPVLVLGWGDLPRENSLATVNKSIAEQVVQHLINLGHERIAHVSYAPLKQNGACVRYDGYRAALKGAGIRFQKSLFAEGCFTCSSGYDGMERILKSAVRPTALFAGNDTIAIGAMAAIRAAGLSIPEDIAIASIDDIPAAAFAHPPLTTMQTYPIEQGQLAAQRAIALLDGQAPPSEPALIQPKLVIRESCGAQKFAKAK